METEALLDVTLEIADGEFVGIIGPTGSGKSTLIQHFNGLLLPSSGKVWVDGVDLTHKDTQLRQIRQKVGMVFQYPEHQLFGETVLEDVGSVSYTHLDVYKRQAAGHRLLPRAASPPGPACAGTADQDQRQDAQGSQAYSRQEEIG